MPMSLLPSGGAAQAQAQARGQPTTEPLGASWLEWQHFSRAVGTWTRTISGHAAMASRPRKKRVTPRARASYETAMMLPLAAEGMTSLPLLNTTRAAAGSAGRETTPEALAEPSPWKGLYCTTANGTPSSDESSPRSQAQSAWRGAGVESRSGRLQSRVLWRCVCVVAHRSSPCR